VWQVYERRARPPSSLFRLGILAIVGGALGAGYEVDSSDGDAVDGGIRTDHGPSDGHVEIVVELGGRALSCGWLSPSASGNTA